MKHSSMVFAAALALSGMAYAAEGNAAGDDHYVDNMVECISDFIAAELEDAMKDDFVTECMQKKTAGNEQPAGRKG